MKKALVIGVAALMFVSAACSSDDDDKADEATDITTKTSTTLAPLPVAGTIVVSAATSLSTAFAEVEKAFEAANPDSDVQLNFGASSTLAQQIVDGAGADVFASADQANMDKLAAADLIDESAEFAENALTIVTKPGNASNIKGLVDLPRVGVVALCGAEVPCGTYAAEALAKAKVTIDESKVTRAQNAAATLSAVADGDAVAGIVYVTDARNNPKVATVSIPEEQNVVAKYPAAALSKSANLTAAEAFVAFLRGAVAQQILVSFGFSPFS